MSAVKVGQVWRDKDKRRNTVIEILKLVDNYAQALVVGTEEERSYDIERLTKRWIMTKDAPEPIKAAASKNWQLKAVCRHNEDYKVRFTKRISEVYGMPLCPCHKEPLIFTEGH